MPQVHRRRPASYRLNPDTYAISHAGNRYRVRVWIRVTPNVRRWRGLKVSANCNLHTIGVYQSAADARLARDLFLLRYVRDATTIFPWIGHDEPRLRRLLERVEANGKHKKA